MAEEPDNTRTKPPANLASLVKRFLPLALIAAGIAVVYLADLDRYLSFGMLAERHAKLAAKVAAHPVGFSVGFFVVYVAAVACSLPGAFVLTIVAGFVFGVIWGGLIVAVAATIGATLLFLAARSAAGEGLAQRAGPFAERFAAGFREDAFNYLLILRLIPIFPFFIVNIAPALFNVRTSTYVAATLLGILPGTFVFAWVGSGLDQVLEKAAAMGRNPTPGDFLSPGLIAAFFALALVAAVPVLYRRYRRRGLRRDATPRNKTE